MEQAIREKKRDDDLEREESMRIAAKFPLLWSEDSLEPHQSDSTNIQPPSLSFDLPVHSGPAKQVELKLNVTRDKTSSNFFVNTKGPANFFKSLHPGMKRRKYQKTKHPFRALQISEAL